MAKFTKVTLFKDTVPRAETIMDKITRESKKIIDDETEKRESKTARLRKARLEREGCTVDNTLESTPKTNRKKPASEAAKKR